MADWTEFAHSSAFTYDVSRVKRNWTKLHAADALPLPANPRLLEAWSFFHSGRFEEAVQSGTKLGPDGLAVVCKATCAYANYLESCEKDRQTLFLDVAKRAAEHCHLHPGDANAFYWHGYALGRYSQRISVAKALAQGVGGKVKNALETALTLEPAHADAHVALATFHSEVIDKVGALIGNMTYGVRRDTGLALFAKALSLCPSSPYVLIEAAHGRMLLDSEGLASEAQALYAQALRLKPRDAQEQLLLDQTRQALSR